MTIPLFDTASQLKPLRKELDSAVSRVLDSGRFILGPEVSEFEGEFARYVGAKHAIGVGNGTDALMIALRAVGVEAGDDVIVPSFTFYASAEAISAIGARPVFCDIDPATFNITAETVAAALTPNTSAIVAVHLFGMPAPIDQIAEVAAERRLKIVEDAAQAVGAKLDGRPVGSLGDAATFSFFPSKNLGGFGDGGMVTTNDASVAEAARLLRHHGTTDKRTHTIVGYNSRLDAIQAAMLRVLLPKLDDWNAARREAAALYDVHGIAEHAQPQAASLLAEPVYHLYMVSHPDPDTAAAKLERAGIEARSYYTTPIHLQPAMLQQAEGVDLPATAEASAHNIALPISPVITEGQIQQVVSALGE